jgi:hypothetical protein
VEYLVGVLVAAGIAGVAWGVGFYRERSFGVAVTMAVATYYVLFALIGGSGWTVVWESVVAAGFIGLGLVGFRKNLWLVAAAIAGHGIFDLVHHLFIDNPGVPHWWPGFCLAFDVPFGVWIGVLLYRGAPPPLAAKPPRVE